VNIREIIIDVVVEIGKELKVNELLVANEETRLFGETLDSMGVVFLVAELEDRISDEFGLSVSLADERAMSQKTSPFRSIHTLSKYVEKLIVEARENA